MYGLCERLPTFLSFAACATHSPVSLAATHPRVLRPSLLSLCVFCLAGREQAPSRVEVVPSLYQIHEYTDKSNEFSIFWVSSVRPYRARTPNAVTPRTPLQCPNYCQVLVSSQPSLPSFQSNRFPKRRRAGRDQTRPRLPTPSLPPEGRLAPRTLCNSLNQSKKIKPSDARVTPRCHPPNPSPS